ncbi:MAG: 2-C-methyl-D-erythritol 2,4-cyclodiphosphate synthase [Thermotoga sp. 50_1627]|uniref:2-C-methyl-D-erythritol 2,4-cyclodiphosphate synthase n=1 Tax=Pseudothermotoga sp. TaxID=2033661 RepID=UPI00076CE73D|nr:MAG: 2-C-methyl-D-erythritol 2,4-cyclodiphosphate synthase [Thermotoga sp. 50_64]KUK24639.1 MAG: 2-C-methyl-D-erythritol 2,4-cyclodiphosphate synthase [Thermotoga sp. 50_1627]MBC7117247.1 2-C-methyl-D-erythritol 2,4-cyclodiphosphate synthase [Pseudothermotoga sp.]MDK2924074.1 2-C-methyl-D-erythritol 2,4-cyclodiphosphate synthase [Pseudothermotoga sp.]HBT39559.1 2-C-methyl-D-erythritol 2,4-cyclodiphosphate synthase [Pseudothermotoga sp.]
MNLRVGIGTDRHPLKKPGRMVLGGTVVSEEVGLEGHSDADVVCHALIDALFGAAGIGDIGEYFDQSERWRGASSLVMLKQTKELLAQKGWTIVNVDVTVTCGAVKLSPFREKMIETLASSLGIDMESVNVKFKTANGLGFEASEGASAIAVCLISRSPSG